MLEDKMKKVDLFVCSPSDMRACASWTAAVEAFPVTGITLPGALDFASLAQLLTGSAAPALVPAGIEGRDLYVFRAGVGQALGRLAADELNRLAVAWSSMAPWARFGDQSLRPGRLSDGIAVSLASSREAGQGAVCLGGRVKCGGPGGPPPY